MTYFTKEENEAQRCELSCKPRQSVPRVHAETSLCRPVAASCHVDSRSERPFSLDSQKLAAVAGWAQAVHPPLQESWHGSTGGPRRSSLPPLSCVSQETKAQEWEGAGLKAQGQTLAQRGSGCRCFHSLPRSSRCSGIFRAPGDTSEQDRPRSLPRCPLHSLGETWKAGKTSPWSMHLVY